MTNQIKNFIEEGEKEFEEKFGNITNALCIRGSYVVTPETDPVNKLKDFISSRQISLIKMIVEMVESEKASENEIERQQENGEWNVYSNEHKNKILDTISSKLKEVYTQK